MTTAMGKFFHLFFRLRLLLPTSWDILPLLAIIHTPSTSSTMPRYHIHQGDCMQAMQSLTDHSIDLILCDLPYGCTNCDWDKPLPWEPLWGEYKRLVKSTGVVALFGTLRFGLEMIASNRKWFRYEWVLAKSRCLGFFDCNRRPLRQHEFLFIFSPRQGTYNPQKTPGKPYRGGRTSHNSIYHTPIVSTAPGVRTERYPKDIIHMPQVQHTQHPTQKPLELMEYLVKTYTNPDDLVLDTCMGSGSTGVACLRTGRRFIGMEMDADFFAVAERRLRESEEDGTCA